MGWDLPFPILLDPLQTVARQADLTVTPEAVVLLPDGQVIYRGRIDDRLAADGTRRAKPQARELEDALEAILADEMPVVTSTVALGTRLIPRSPSADPGETITFNNHVAPILWKNCAKCHRPGEVGPFSLLSYRDAAKRADFIREVTAADQMPPWKALPGAGVFVDAPRLSAIEKEILARWAETGCAEGGPGDLPPRPRFSDSWSLGQPDLVLTMPEPLELSRAGADLYRAFAIPFPLDRDVTIRGIEFRPGNRKIVHHSRIHLDATGDARRRDRTDPGPGFSAWVKKVSFELPYPGLGGWTPGMTPRFAPEGAGRVIPRGSDIVFQIHYHRSGKVENDQSSVGLYVAKGPVTRKLTGLTLSTDRIDIPAGASATRSSRPRGSGPTSDSTPSCPTPITSAASSGWPQPCPTDVVSLCSGSTTGISTGRTSIASPCPSGCPRGPSSPWPPTSITPKTIRTIPTSLPGACATVWAPRTRCAPATSRSSPTTRAATRLIRTSPRSAFERRARAGISCAVVAAFSKWRTPPPCQMGIGPTEDR